MMIQSEIKLLSEQTLIISRNWCKLVSELESVYREGFIDGKEAIQDALECYAPYLFSQLGDIIKKAIDLKNNIRKVFIILLTPKYL
jgi:hypothetical protein